MQDLPRTTISSFSKICDIYDWFDPAFDRVVREALRVEPGANRRQWEFAMIYLALHEAGALRADARGLGMGAGTERLIYAIAERVAEARVTDLYEAGSRWETARADDPQALVMSRAPWPLPEGRIRAERADMRRLPYPDASFDFAWSTGAFEHIGEDADFRAHLDEVDRVLKPGGVYAFTTVLNLERETSRIPNNYYFHPDHFVDLLHVSKLEPDPVYDLRLRTHCLNRPMPETARPHGVGGFESHLHPTVAFRRGIVNVANVALLRKGTGAPKTRPRIVGFAESLAWAQRHALGYNVRFWSERQPLALEPRGARSAATAWHSFGAGSVEIDVEAPGATALLAFARARITPDAPEVVRRVDLDRDGRARFAVSVDAEKTYLLRLDGFAPGAGQAALDRARLHARRAQGAA